MAKELRIGSCKEQLKELVVPSSERLGGRGQDRKKVVCVRELDLLWVASQGDTRDQWARATGKSLYAQNNGHPSPVSQSCPQDWGCSIMAWRTCLNESFKKLGSE